MSEIRDPYRLVKSRICDLLDLLHIGVQYQRASIDLLYYTNEIEEVEILDVVGGYGSLILGHNHPDIVKSAQAFLAEGRPVHTQGSRHTLTGVLAHKLSQRAGGKYRVLFANSGAEAVEAAMKHAMLETGSRSFITLKGGFHGKTLGALQLTANEKYREPFSLDGLDVRRVTPNDIEHLEQTFSRAGRIAGMVFEPILGEGGVFPLNEAFLKRVAELCKEQGAPLIADEIQTGMGRTGSFYASEQLGIRPDYILLSKALGGGIAKISAILIDSSRYKDDFDLIHTSTFADDEFSSTIALKTVELIDADLLKACREKGEYLIERLSKLAEAYPEIIADVRGRGLMIGIELQRLNTSPNFFQRMLSDMERLGFIVCGYLFNRHQIRIAPTLSEPFTLRLEPSAFIEVSDMNRVIDAIDDVCACLQERDMAEVTRYFVDGERMAYQETFLPRVADNYCFYNETSFREREQNVPTTRIGWVFHLIDANDLMALDPSFSKLSFTEREAYLEHLAHEITPIVMDSVDIHSVTGETVRFNAILLPVTARWIKERMLKGEDSIRPFHEAVQAAVDIAMNIGCQVVSLGQYTSIVTHNGQSLRESGPGITTGNNYAAALAIQAIERAMEQRGWDPSSKTLAVIGASGNIGSTCAAIMAPKFQKVALFGSGRKGSTMRLQELVGLLPNARVAFDYKEVNEADIVVAATSAVDRLLGPEHFAENAIVCDLSIPTCIRSEAQDERPDLFLIKGGIASLPGHEDLEIVGFPLPQAAIYACMAEGMMLGFEGIFDRTYTGRITEEKVKWIRKVAARHGFDLTSIEESYVLGND